MLKEITRPENCTKEFETLSVMLKEKLGYNNANKLMR